MSKKNNQKRDVIVETATDEVKKLSTILVAIIGIVCLFYIITVFVTKNNSGLNFNVQDEVSEISYDTILASDIFGKNGTYYVLAYDEENPYVSLFKTYINEYMKLEQHDMVYYVDLSDAFNQKYISDESSFDKNHLAFSSTTLLKINNGNIESTYDTDETIQNYLKNLIKTV